MNGGNHRDGQSAKWETSTTYHHTYRKNDLATMMVIYNILTEWIFNESGDVYD